MSTPVYSLIALPFAVELTAVTFGALSGALHANRKGFDPIGIFTIAILSAVGGGAIRDVLLQGGVPVFLVSPTFLSIAAVASVVGFFLAGFIKAAKPVMDVVDTLLIGVWVVLGAEKALLVDLNISTAVLLGVLTATGGGLVRDLLCREVPAIARPGEWYAAAAVVAAVLFVTLVSQGVAIEIAEIATILTAAALRASSVRFGWRTPTAYDLWSDLEARVSAGLESLQRGRDERLRQRT